MNPPDGRVVVLLPSSPFLWPRICCHRPGFEPELQLRPQRESYRRPRPIGLGTLEQLPTSPIGKKHRRTWTFADQLGPGFHEAVRISASVEEETSVEIVDLGNDPPVLLGVSTPLQEISGITPIDLLIADSAFDDVEIQIRYAVVDGFDWVAGERPNQNEFRPATSAGLSVFPSQPTPSGEPATFFWDVIADLGLTEHDVAVEITPRDSASGPSVLTAPFRVDNESDPTVLINGAAFVGSSDDSNVIPIPFDAFDAHEQPVDLVFQWLDPTQADDPDLDLSGKNPGALETIRTDHILRKDFQICTEAGRSLKGRLQPRDTLNSLKVRLPELSRSTSWTSNNALVNQTLDILRPIGIPADITKA
jgi:hypothetical protein